MQRYRSTNVYLGQRGHMYAGPEVDVWSCGIILYALLCGRLPFDDEHMPRLLKKIQQGFFTVPSSVGAMERELIEKIVTVDPY